MTAYNDVMRPCARNRIDLVDSRTTVSDSCKALEPIVSVPLSTAHMRLLREIIGPLVLTELTVPSFFYQIPIYFSQSPPAKILHRQTGNAGIYYGSHGSGSAFGRGATSPLLA